MVDSIVTRGDAVLHKKAKEVPQKFFETGELGEMARRMSASLRTTEHGVAIAAPQIGIPYRIFVVRGFILTGMTRTDKNADQEADVAFVNPKFTKRSRKKELMEEACLSVPGYGGRIKRSTQVTLRAQDAEGKKIERGASGLLAQIFQHECDHLDGTLYIEKAEEVFELKNEKEKISND